MAWTRLTRHKGLDQADKAQGHGPSTRDADCVGTVTSGQAPGTIRKLNYTESPFPEKLHLDLNSPEKFKISNLLMTTNIFKN